MLIFRSVNSLNKLIELSEMFLCSQLTEILETRLYQLHMQLLKGRGYIIFLNVLFELKESLDLVPFYFIFVSHFPDCIS